MSPSLGRSKPFSMPNAAGMQLLLQIRNQPRRATPWGTRGLLTTTRRGERALFIDEVSDFSIEHIIATASPGSTRQISGERTRLACWRWRPRHRELLAIKGFGERRNQRARARARSKAEAVDQTNSDSVLIRRLRRHSTTSKTPNAFASRCRFSLSIEIGASPLLILTISS